MKVIAAIPARYAASRFPGKLLADLNGKPVIQHTYENVLNSGLFDRVIVVTENSKIESAVLGFGGHVVRSQKDHQCGSDRIAEAVFDLDIDIVINVQGDEPFVHSEGLASLIEVFKSDTKKGIYLTYYLSTIYIVGKFIEIITNYGLDYRLSWLICVLSAAFLNFIFLKLIAFKG